MVVPLLLRRRGGREKEGKKEEMKEGMREERRREREGGRKREKKMGKREEKSCICKKKGHISKYCPERRNGCFNCGELGHKKYECTKEGGGAYVDPVLKRNGMTYMSGVRNLELEEKMKKENEEKAGASEGLGVILTDSSSKNEGKEVEARELSSSLSTLDEKGEGNFISNSSLTQETLLYGNGR